MPRLDRGIHSAAFALLGSAHGMDCRGKPGNDDKRRAQGRSREATLPDSNLPSSPYVPLSLQTLYADLVQQAHAGFPDLGSVYTQTQKGVDYLYANRTVGATRRH